MLGDDSIVLLIVLICMVVMSAYFSATETAFTSLNRIRLKSRADNGDARAARVLALADKYDQLLSTILIGNNIVNNVATTLSAVLFIDLLGKTSGPAVSTVVLTIVILIFGEVSPKSLAKESPESFALFSAPILRFFMVILTPATFFFSLWKKLLSKIFHTKEDVGITNEELVTMVTEAEDQGGLDAEESQLICSAIRFDDLEASDILTPRVDIVALEDTATMEEATALFAQEGYSRMPVYHESLDNVVGVIHQKDLFAARYHGRTQLVPLIHPVLHVTTGTKIDDLMRQFQRTKTHMAIVVDEYGGTAGIITIEDLLEEIVGDIFDEFDPAEPQDLTQVGDGIWRVAGSMRVEDFAEEVDFDLPEDRDYDTVAGMILSVLPSIPVDGTTPTVKVCGLQFDVQTIEDRKILWSIVRKLAPEPAPEEEESRRRHRKRDRDEEKEAPTDNE